jgi:hypothetical protein
MNAVDEEVQRSEVGLERKGKNREVITREGRHHLNMCPKVKINVNNKQTLFLQRLI